MKKKILAVTGIRSEYDILYPVIDLLRKDGNFEVKVVVCGAHLSDWHGVTLNRIKRDGFNIADKIDYLLMTNRKVQRAKGAGILTSALAQTAERENPDFLMVVGDREESIATAIVGNYMDILTAHIGGGDTVYGNADDPLRFAVSKLAHIHFALSRISAQKLLGVGEEKFRVFCSGDPAIDNIRSTPPVPLKKLCRYLDFDISDGNYVVLIKHPLSSEKEDAHRQMRITMESLDKFCGETNVKVVGIYPNTDPGSFDILKVIDEYADSRHVKFYKTLPKEIFVNVMRNTLALAGNSSMGILESPFYKVPVVNIGERQRGRFNAGNVKFVGHDMLKIKKALYQACFDRAYRKRVRSLENPFGDGQAAVKIRDVLATIDAGDKRWYVKKKLC